ncbi:hypothetical protein BH09ACT4_BH09ACT4_10830 [soil metagenome]
MLAAYRRRMASNEKRSAWGDSTSWIFGMLVGLAIGISLGVAMANLGVGIGIGAAIGVAFALAFSQSKRSERPRNRVDADRD